MEEALNDVTPPKASGLSKVADRVPETSSGVKEMILPSTSFPVAGKGVKGGGEG
jgi:hypothetical protein